MSVLGYTVANLTERAGTGLTKEAMVISKRRLP